MTPDATEICPDRVQWSPTGDLVVLPVHSFENKMSSLAGRVFRLILTPTLLFGPLLILIRTVSGADGYKEWCGK